MGQFLLRVPDEIIQTVDNTVWDDMYFAGIDGTPWQTKTQFQDGLLTVKSKYRPLENSISLGRLRAWVLGSLYL